MMNVRFLMDDASIDAKFDDFAKRDGRTERPTDGPTDGQTHRLIGMRWTMAFIIFFTTTSSSLNSFFIGIPFCLFGFALLIFYQHYWRQGGV